MPKVSVIIPTHNRSELLRSAISTVIAQTFKDWELLVVDDHSTDNTPAVVDGFADVRVKYLRNKGKNGPSIARNMGISAASGEYVAFLDDDDEWYPHKLEKQISILDTCTNEICGIYSKPWMIDKLTGNTLSNERHANTLKGSLLSQLMIKNPIHTCTVVVRKSCFDEIGVFDETMRYMEDRDLWIRLSMRWDFEYIDEPLTKAYYNGNEHLSHNLDAQTQGREILLQRYRKLLKKNKKSWSNLYVCLGAQYCQLGKMKQGRKNLIKGFLIYPFRKITFFHLCTSFLGAAHYQQIRKYYKTSRFD